MKKKILFFLLLFMLPVLSVNALCNHISIGVKNTDGNIVQYAHVELIKNKRTIYNGLVNTGVAEFDNIKPDNYTLKITSNTYEDYITNIKITSENKQEFNYIIKQKEIGDNTKTPDSKINVKVLYFDDEVVINKTPDKIETYSFDAYKDEINKIKVNLEKSSYITFASITNEISYVQPHDNSCVEISLTPTKDEYNLTFYVKRNWTSRLYYYEAKYENDTWENFIEYNSYIDNTNTPKASTYNMIFGDKVNLVPIQIENYDLNKSYALYYYNGGISKRITLEEVGLSMDKDGNITGYGPVLSQNEFLLIYFYYTKSIGNVTVNYVDESNNKINDTIYLKGFINEKYETSKLLIDNYEFDKVIGNETGNYTKDNIEITYVYKKVVTASLNEKIPYTGVNNALTTISIVNSLISFIGIIIFKKH